MQAVDLNFTLDEQGRVWLDRDSVCLWLFEAADEAVACRLSPDAEFCVRSLAEMLILFPNHKG